MTSWGDPHLAFHAMFVNKLGVPSELMGDPWWPQLQRITGNSCWCSMMFVSNFQGVAIVQAILIMVSWGPVLARSPAGPQGSVGSLGLIGFFCCVFALVCGNFVAVTALCAWCGRHRNHTCEGGVEQARCRFLFLQATLLTNWCTQAHRCLDSIHSDIAGKESRPPIIFLRRGKGEYVGRTLRRCFIQEVSMALQFLMQEPWCLVVHASPFICPIIGNSWFETLICGLHLATCPSVILGICVFSNFAAMVPRGLTLCTDQI